MKLYHWVPDPFEGSILYSLNRLRVLYPEVYAKARKKYEGREHITEQRIPIFDCWWNDVVFLSPIHPTIINQKREYYGIPRYEKSFFEIPSERLNKKKMMMFRHRPKWLISKEPKPSEFVPYQEISREERKNLSNFPEAAEWAMGKFGKESFLFAYMPHILYLGNIETKGLHRIQS